MSLGRIRFFRNMLNRIVVFFNAPPVYYLIGLRGQLFVDYPWHEEPSAGVSCDNEASIKYRSADGTCNDLSMPQMGAVGTPFVRNLKPTPAHENGYADAATVAEILRRPADAKEDPKKRAPFSTMVAAWIQFMTHDWFAHDPTQNGGDDDAVATNQVTHWWDASQMYGSSEHQKAVVRNETTGGKLRLDDDGELDYDEDGVALTGFTDNFWPGLHVLHTLFAREHNYIVDQLSTLYPDTTDDERFEIARLCVSAVLAKIHTIEWTPTLLDNEVSTIALNVNWWGLNGALSEWFDMGRMEKWKWILDTLITPSFGEGIAMYNTSFFMTEEFVAVYRMHTLMPDELTVESGDETSTASTTSYSLKDLTFADARTLEPQDTSSKFLKSIGTTPSGTLGLKNYPDEFFDLEMPGGAKVSLAQIDIERDRERGLPRYNDARRQLLLDPYTSFDDFVADEEDKALLRTVYSDVDQVDLVIGCLLDKDGPIGFAFGMVAYHIFLVMASRRILSDRFFQDMFTEEHYTAFGVDYVNKATFREIVLRHFPEHESIVPENPFMTWTTTTA